MREPRILIVLVLAAALLFAVSAAAQVIVLTRATVVDGTGAGPQKDFTIIIENGRIRDMGPSSKISVPAGATVWTSAASSSHLASSTPTATSAQKREPQLRQYALYGVTTTTSMQTRSGRSRPGAGSAKARRVARRESLHVKYRFAPDPEVRHAGAGARQGRRDRRRGRRLHQGLGGQRVRHAGQAQS